MNITSISPLQQLRQLMVAIHQMPDSEAATTMADMAAILLQQVELRVGETRYRLADIEFYLHSNQHQDTFIHGDDEQLQCGRWFYNRAGGVDLTFGNGTDRGGILVRGLLRLEGAGGAVYGPQCVLRELVAAQAPVWEPTGGWWLAEAAEAQPGPVWQAERVNLKQLENPYRARPYRFLAHADYLRQLPTSVRSKVWRELGVTKELLAAPVSHA